MPRILESKAIIWARDATGGTFAAVADKIKAISSASKAVSGTKAAIVNLGQKVDGVRAKVVRQIAPWRTRTQDPEDDVEHAAVIYTRNAARFVRQERLDGRPFVIGVSS